MFASAAIKSFKKTVTTKTWDGLTNKNMLLLVDNLPNAQKYHLGDEGLLNLVDEQIKKHEDRDKEQAAFMDDLAIDVRLPFDVCWFDFIDKDFLQRIHPNGPPIKIGMFVSNTNPDKEDGLPENMIQIILCFQFGPSGIWCIGPETCFIKIGSNYTYEEAKNLHEKIINNKDTNPKIEKFMERRYKIYEQGNMITFPTGDYSGATIDKESLKVQVRIAKLIQDRAVTVLNMFLMILNCKNVVTETTNAQGKKRVKDKFKWMNYKVLKFKLPKSRKKNVNSPLKNDEYSLTALHLCSGHFKTYTEEAPLFGKIVGRWWWHSHTRGNKIHGEVIKDYHPITH